MQAVAEGCRQLRSETEPELLNDAIIYCRSLLRSGPIDQAIRRGQKCLPHVGLLAKINPSKWWTFRMVNYL